MSAESPVPFANNWAYLKTELSWLERLLMLAVARQRQDTKAINRVARDRADRISSHWWQGIISIQAHGEGPTKAGAIKGAAGSYQQQLEARLQASQQQGIGLALPRLKAAFNLSVFEKNLILLTLAPEVDLRYGRLYAYLQTGEESALGTLPTVELVLRLLCRNDLERLRAREQLTGSTSLMQRQILRCVTSASHTFLGSYLRLETDWINYLLAENPDSAWLAARCQRKSVVPPAQSTTALPVRWEQLILSSTLKTQLQTLTQQVAAGAHPAVLLVGARGTGKTTAARALATALQQPLTLIDLANQPGVPGSRPESPLLLIKSAQHWFGRSAELSSAQLSQWLQQRRQQPGLTILTLRYRHLIPAAWRQRFDVVLDLPSPTATQRQQLWQQALSLTSQGEDDSRDAWQRQLRMLAQKLPLTGGQINAIAQTAIDLAQTAGTAVVQLPQLQQALVQHGQTVHLKDSLN